MSVENETIQSDVSAEVDEQGAPLEEQQPESIPDNPISRREAKMAEVHEKRQEEQAEDRAEMARINNLEDDDDGYDEGGEEAQPAHGDGDGGEAGHRSYEEDTQANGWSTRENGERVKRLNVNGTVVELSEEQYDRQVSKSLAGDDKLRKAAEIQQQQLAREKQLQERERRLQESEQLPPPGASEDVKQMVDDALEGLLDGDKDAARDKLLDAISAGRQSSTPNIDEIVSRAATQAEAKVDAKYAKRDADKVAGTAFNNFKSDFSDVIAARNGIENADLEVKRLQRERPEMPLNDMFQEAGRITRELLGLSGEKPTPQIPAGQTNADRLAAKGKISPLPRSRSQRHSQPKPEKRDLSAKAVIERQRAARAR